MIQLVLSTGGFYFSRTYDLSHSAQWLAENATPVFKRLPMMGRVRYFCFSISALNRFFLPLNLIMIFAFL